MDAERALTRRELRAREVAAASGSKVGAPPDDGVRASDAEDAGRGPQSRPTADFAALTPIPQGGLNAGIARASIPDASPTEAPVPDSPLADAAGPRRRRNRGDSVAISPLGPDEPRAAAPAPSSRAGRDLPAAIGVGVGLLALLGASLFIWKEAFGVLAVLVCGGALWELARALKSNDIHIPLPPLLVGSAGMLMSAYIAGVEALLVSFVLTAGGVMLWRTLDGGGPLALRDTTAAILAAAYIPFLAGFSIVMLQAPDGQWRVLTFILVVIASDTGGYIAGVLAGRHPIAPTVSPKKSWEGFAGSVGLATIVALVASAFLLDGPLWLGPALGLMAAITSTLGDLCESLLKRDLGVKDMGSILPGHGGLLDRLDSLLVTAPAAAVLLAVAVPVPA